MPRPRNGRPPIAPRGPGRVRPISPPPSPPRASTASACRASPPRPPHSTRGRAAPPRRPGDARAAARTLVALGAKEALADLDAVRTGRPEPQLRVHAAAALWAFGDARGWPDFEAAAKHKDADARAAAATALAGVRDPRAVDLLLVLLKDDGFLFTSHGGDQVVGDEAAGALLTLTGVFFRRDAAKWTAWWTDEAKRVVPTSPDTTEARAAFDAWMDEREEAHQKKMRESLPPGFRPK